MSNKNSSVTPSLLTRVARKTSQCGSRITESSSLSASCASIPPPGNAASCTNAALAATDDRALHV